MQFENAIPIIENFKHINGSHEWLIEYKTINHTDLTYIIGGQAIYTINRQKIFVEEGDMLCIPKGSELSAASNEPAKFECFAANFNLVSLDSEEISVPLPLHTKTGVHSDLISHYRKLAEDFATRSPGYVMRSRARLMLILQRFMEMLVYEVETFRYDPRVKQAIRHITEHYAEPLTISAVAATVSLNAVYFGTLFKRETRVTFRDFLNTIRINKAEDMLRAGKWNVTEVAGHCGYNDVFYFSRLFKKYKGIPPSAVQ
ncbi:MAG: helix-turn-helix domain-containing protein [Defluviitaleaceae bacterium]|nr:helix-turn-helix domain-containing protein [Defluviitaleaceae bacterium]